MMMMLMEGDQELEATQMMMIKGKRTKRPRLPSPALALTTTTASSSSTAGGGLGGLDDDHDDLHHHHHQDLVIGPRLISVSTTDGGSSSSPPATTSAEFTDISTQQEDQDQDMAANCLILLAQGTQTPPKPQQQPQPTVQNKAASTATATTTAGLYDHAYECKTCNRCFPSFQALGGHRASHKKLKANNNNNKVQETSIKTLSFMADQEDQYDHRGFNNNNNTASTTLSLQISNRGLRALSSSTSTSTIGANCNIIGMMNNKPNKKVHECSVCGAEFTSGQALGGHMRRHRTFTNTSTTPSKSSTPQPQLGFKRPRDFLQLDLNLPAPEDQDHHRLEITKLPFASSNSSNKEQQVLVFSASQSLVGCHY